MIGFRLRGDGSYKAVGRGGRVVDDGMECKSEATDE